MKEKKKIVNRQLSIVNWIGLVLVSVKRRNEVERPERRLSERSEFATRTAKRSDGVAQQTQP